MSDNTAKAKASLNSKRKACQYANHNIAKVYIKVSAGIMCLAHMPGKPVTLGFKIPSDTANSVGHSIIHIGTKIAGALTAIILGKPVRPRKITFKTIAIILQISQPSPRITGISSACKIR